MKKLLSIALVCISISSFSQDVSKKIDEQAKNPKTRENAAKADVFISDKKKLVVDTVTSVKSVSKTVMSSDKIKKKRKVKKG